MAVPQQLLDMQETIRRNAEDLREELAALERWEAEVQVKEMANKKKTFIEADLPPVRGTAKPAEAPKKPKEDPILTAKDQGNEYFRQCKFEDAARCYSRGIAMDPESSTMHVMYSNRAMCYIKLQLWDLAEKDASTCVQMNRTFVKGFFRRAVARKAMGKLKDARADLETALVLSPGDKEAESELKSVTALLQAQAKAEGASTSATAPAAKKKKLVIEEVEDEDDTPPAAAAKPSASPASSPAKESDVERQEREARHKRDHEAARKAEADRAAQRRKEAEAAEAKLKNSRRSNSRVEEIEDDDTPPPAKPREVPAPAPATAPAPAPAAAKPAAAAAAAKHADPSPPRNIAVEITKESLSAPKSFVEFEMQYGSIMKKAPLLLEHYLSLIPSTKWVAVFGSSMTPEILSDVLKAANTAADQVAVNVLVGVASLPRVQEVIMFMDDEEKDQCAKTATRLEGIASGAADKQGLAKLRSLLAL